MLDRVSVDERKFFKIFINSEQKGEKMTSCNRELENK